jgi:hypothetical protein
VVPEQPADLTREPSNLVLLHLTPSHSEPHGRGDHAVPINQCSEIESWCLQGQPSEPDPEQTSAFGNTVEPREWPGWARNGHSRSADAIFAPGTKRTGGFSRLSTSERGAEPVLRT